MKIAVVFILFIAALVAGQKQSVNITAQSFQANEKEGYTLFEGNVHIIKGSSELNASKVIVFFNEDKVAKRYEAYEDVYFDIIQDDTHYKGTSQELIYYPLDEIYEFYVDVDLTDVINRRNVKGDAVEVDLAKGLASVIGSDEKPVKFRFELESE